MLGIVGDIKACLWYLCIYPEDANISCEEPKWKWIAEGFIATKRVNLYQEAESCFNELVNRSLIQRVDVNVHYYDFNNIVRFMIWCLTLLISLSDEENFARVLNRVCSPLPNKVR